MYMFGFCWSGWQDSNLRPPAPKAGAITGLRYTPNGVKFMNFWRTCPSRSSKAFTKDDDGGETGIRTRATLTR